MRTSSKRTAFSFIVLPAAILWIVPYLWVLFNAFALKDPASAAGFRITLGIMKDVLNAAPFVRYFVNSSVIVSGIVLAQIATVTLASYAFARVKFAGSGFLFAVLLFQIVIPNDLLIVPNYQTIANLSSINTLRGIMLPFFGSAFGIFNLRQTFKSIPIDFEQSAEIDGCGLWGKLWHVYMPMSIPAYIAFSMVSVSAHWNDFLWPLIITNSDKARPMTVGLALFATSFETGARWGEVSAATLLVTAPLLVLFLAFQRKFTESFAFSSGLK